jgi:hypothetical protein
MYLITISEILAKLIVHQLADRRDVMKWCIGITVDADRGQIYWTQKGPENAGKGRIFREGIEIPKGETAVTRNDIEVLFDDLPEPIDLELDLNSRALYWTDRGDPPTEEGEQKKFLAPEILLIHLMEGIGIALDPKGDRMFVTDLGGSIYSAKLDGSDKKILLAAQGNLSGIAYSEVSSKYV